jgi:uncharacterized protein YjbI with pentapeptide repeats
MVNCDFYSANLTTVNMMRSELLGVNFHNATLIWALLEDANLRSAGFLKTNLTGAKLMNADLTDAHFLDANLQEANLAGANVSGVEFSVGGPQTVKGLTQAQLDEARADPANPPVLTGVVDAETGEPLVWRGKGLLE